MATYRCHGSIRVLSSSGSRVKVEIENPFASGMEDSDSNADSCSEVAGGEDTMLSLLDLTSTER
jgi:hypothetical protein